MPLAKYRWLIVFLNVAVLWGAGATTVMPMDVQKLSEKAQIVVHGRVFEIKNENGARYAQVEIFEQVRGIEVTSPVSVDLLQKASRKEGWVERVAEAMELRVGEEVLVFLNRSHRNQRWVPVGLQQGKYRIVTDQRGVRRALSWKDGAINRVSDSELLNSSRSVVIISAKESALTNRDLEKTETLSNLINKVRGF